MSLSDPVLRLTAAQFGYHGRVAARGDLTVNAGEVVAVVGANGSGKSTLIRGALGVVSCLGGDIDWFGQPLAQFRDRSRVGYVPQRQSLISPVPATLEEVVRTGRISSTGIFRRYPRYDREAVAEAIDAVGLAGRQHLTFSQLSSGQQRRALVARAIAGDADIFVLDEPFAGVDAESQEAMTSVFSNLVRNGSTVIVVLHELGPMELLVTRRVALVSGDIVFDDEPTFALS